MFQLIRLSILIFPHWDVQRFVACVYQSPLCGQPKENVHPTRNENCRLKQFLSQHILKHRTNGCVKISFLRKLWDCFEKENIFLAFVPKWLQMVRGIEWLLRGSFWTQPSWILCDLLLVSINKLLCYFWFLGLQQSRVCPDRGPGCNWWLTPLCLLCSNILLSPLTLTAASPASRAADN